MVFKLLKDPDSHCFGGQPVSGGDTKVFLSTEFCDLLSSDFLFSFAKENEEMETVRNPRCISTITQVKEKA